MAYTIIKSDGTILTTIADGTLNTTSTSIKLPGKNYAGYGVYFDTNFVQMVENFANAAPPSNALRGQLWFNTNDNNLYVCPADGTSNPDDWLKLSVAEGNVDVTYGNITSTGTVYANNATIVHTITGGNLSISDYANIGNLSTSGTLSVTGNSNLSNVKTTGWVSISDRLYGTATSGIDSFWIGLEGNRAEPGALGIALSSSNSTGNGVVNNVILATNGTNRLYVNANGNIGIGTSTPTSNLHVIGNANVTSNITAGNLSVTNYVTTGFKVGTASANFQVLAGGYTKQTRSANIGISGGAPFWNIKAEDYTGDNSGIYITSIDAGGATGKYISGDGVYYNSSQWQTTSGKTVATAIGLNGGNLKFYTDSGLTPEANYTPTQRMVILSSGNVGINNTSPQQTLVVNGTANITGNITGNTLFTASGAGAVTMTATNKMRQIVNIKDFGAVGDGVTDDTSAINAAITATNTSGAWLVWNEGTYRITSALSVTLPKMRWKGEGAVILVDTATDIVRGVAITLTAGVDHQLVGEGFEVNANGKCHSAIRFLQTAGTVTTNLYLEKVGARNVEMQVGVLEGSHGLSVRGGFGQVKLVDCYAENIMMRTGAGVAGTRGVTGIILQNNFPTAGAYIRNMVLVRPKIRRVYSQDPTWQYDMDGIGLFANPSDVTNGPAYADVSSSDISGCWGRDIKMQVSSSKVDSPKSLINEGPSGGIVNPTYDFQTGSGYVIGGQYDVDGVTKDSSIVCFQITTDGIPMASRWLGGSVDIYNGGSVTPIASMDYISVVTKTVATISDVSVNGSIQNFAQVRTNGFDIHTIKLDGIVCTEITESLVRVIAGSGGVAPYRARVFVKNCVNLGADVPTVRCNIVGLSAKALLDDQVGIGFGPVETYLLSSDQYLTGLSINNSANYPIPDSSGNDSGTQKLYSFSLASSANVTMPGHGYNNNYLAEIVMGATQHTYAYLSVGSSGIDNIAVGSSANVGTTSDPGSGDLRIWRSTGTNQLVIYNGTASTRLFIVRYLG